MYNEIERRTKNEQLFQAFTFSCSRSVAGRQSMRQSQKLSPFHSPSLTPLPSPLASPLTSPFSTPSHSPFATPSPSPMVLQRPTNNNNNVPVISEFHRALAVSNLDLVKLTT